MPELIGIARLAAESPCIEAKRRVEYFELETRKFITRCDSPRAPFRWTINPYRGCEFGCKYCYARYAHEFMELRDPLQFERKIFAKRFDAAGFRAELGKLPRRRSGRAGHCDRSVSAGRATVSGDSRRSWKFSLRARGFGWGSPRNPT